MIPSSAPTVGTTTAVQADASLHAAMSPNDSNLLERARHFQRRFHKTTPEPRSRKHQLIQEEDGNNQPKHRRVLKSPGNDNQNGGDGSDDFGADEEAAAPQEKHNGIKEHSTSRADVDTGTGSGSQNLNSILDTISTANSTAAAVQSVIQDYSDPGAPSSAQNPLQGLNQIVKFSHTAQPSDTVKPAESQNKPEDVWGIFNEMVKELATLQDQNRSLRVIAKSLHQRLFPPKIPPRLQVVHEVSCDCRQPTRVSFFTDQPRFNTFNDSGHIEGRSAVSEESALELSRKAVIILVRKKYTCTRSTRRRRWLRTHSHLQPGQDEDMLAPLCGESATITSDSVCGLLRSVFLSATSVPFDITPDSQIEAPYIFYYHNRAAIKHFASALDSDSRRFVDTIITYFESFSPEFSRADTLFANGHVRQDVLSYLFEPNQVIVQEQNNELYAYLTVAYPTTFGIGNRSCEVTVWQYGYDGRFFIVHNTFKIVCPDTPEPVPITQLSYYPLKYAAKGIEARLRERGKQFWKCRGGRYVQYHDPDSIEVQFNDVRYMVDYGAMPPGETGTRPFEEYLDASTVTDFDLDQGHMLLLFPSVMKGFNMVEKRWEALKMSGVTDVVWNKQAFESLVAESETKEFVQALVTNQLAASKSTDLISGKGAAFPGTGKTLTAESVAELAERPLYKVTCGDIGIDAAGVEFRLQQVLTLGKRWGCVVLLDEADLFLEERSLQDLGRNALVSVFLRALEYYEGILILTTNRVGTFDEAFKSRIQLSLRYHPLTEEQRLLIWENFFKRLEKIDEEGIDICSLRQHVRELARHKMNGREIRNSLTNARQLAKYKGETMDIQHLGRAVRVFNKFEEYTKDIKHGIQDETIARERGER